MSTARISPTRWPASTRRDAVHRRLEDLHHHRDDDQRRTARAWLVERARRERGGAHFCAVSTALPKVAAFGIGEERTFGFWDWVGGRYSLWSAIGLPIMLAIGPENFGRLLDGAHAIDNHFRTAPARENLPMMLGLIGYWHRAICGYPSRAVIPYDQRLARLPAYLQQLDMESNGKGVTLSGEPVDGVSGPVVWGEPGTNGQHAFFQLLHQGTDIVPVEFMIAANGHEPGLRQHHELLIANCLAQSEALMKGRTRGGQGTSFSPRASANRGGGAGAAPGLHRQPAVDHHRL
jgi:glucose-6-phosphate isomerase